MGIKRYIASQDTTITNPFKEDLTTRATNANMGASDSLEIFSIYGQSIESKSSYYLTSGSNSGQILKAITGTLNEFFSNSEALKGNLNADNRVVPSQKGPLRFLKKQMKILRRIKKMHGLSL